MEEEVQPPEASTETSEAQETNPENAGNDNISDSQNDTKDQTDENEDLFGSDDEPSKPNAEEEKITDEIKDEVITDTAEPEEPQQEVLEYSELPRPQDSKLFHVRLPNILGIESKPFDPDTYEEMRSEGLDEEDHKHVVTPETVIRWRYGRDQLGNITKETNSRFVRWNDGSLSLFIGAEVYDVTEQETEQDNSFLFVRQKKYIRCHGQLTSKLTFRPASLTSKTHQKLTNSIVQRHKKERKIKITTAGADPEYEEKNRIKIESDKAKVKSMQEKKKSQYGWNSDYLEGLSDEELLDDMDEEGNIGAIKAKYGKGSKKLPQKKRSREEEEEAERRILKAKESASGRKSNQPLDEEEEEELLSKRRKGGKKKLLED